MEIEMKKVTIAEIENSFLNFFTPALIVALGFFLLNLIGFPLSFFNWFILEMDLLADLNLLNVSFAIFSNFVVFLFTYLVFIPRLKLEDSTYEKPNFGKLIVVPIIFSIAIFFRILLTFSFETSGVKIYYVTPWFLTSYSLLFDPNFLYLFLVYELVTIPLFTEIVYRRMVIPLLEDRGLSPIFAVILSSLGFCFLELPYFISTTNYLGTLFWFISTFIYGFATGMVYILTRNVLFSILYASLYHVYRMIDFLGVIQKNELLLLIRDLIHLAVLLGGLLLLLYITLIIFRKESTAKWIKIIKIKSVPNIKRGIIGFFVISLILLGIQILADTLIAHLTQYPLSFVFYSIFYLIAFSIPFWLSITTEYVQH
jgi:membrane protease YdiL (CAAX protease family)